jgi:hypothetical protein
MKRLKMPILIIIVLCCGLSILGAIISPSKPSTPSAAPAATDGPAPTAIKPKATEASSAGLETATPAVTEGVKPTEAPNATEAPTDEPKPTEAAAATPNTTDAEKAFILSMLDSQTHLAEEQNTFGALMTAAGKDSTKLKDPEWITSVGMQTATVEFRCEEIIKIKSPSKRFDPGVAKIHDGANMLIKAMKLVVVAVDSKDAAKLGQAATLLDDGNQAMKKGLEMLTAVVKQ